MIDIVTGYLDSWRGSNDSTTISVEKVKEGKMPTVFLINGFYSETAKDSSEWMPIVNKLYPDSEVVLVRWKSGNIINQMIDNLSGKAIYSVAQKYLTQRALMLASLSATSALRAISLPATLAYVTFTLSQFGYRWRKSFLETENASRELAKIINSESKYDGCILMGHSLGAKVICHTLQKVTPSRVNHAYLLAGAVINKTELWCNLLSKHNNLCITNCYSSNDLILRYAFPVGVISKIPAIGVSPLKCDQSRVLDLDVTPSVGGHMKFKCEKLAITLAEEANSL
ncbi:hypothetical protein BZG14_12110 [Salinivibrio sp. IB282]|nr:hypothetical protein BZG14_12110 [Salinivibrio sp. IB282]